MADGGEGFVGCVEVVRRTRGYRRWPDAVKARIVAESFRPGARVVDVARRHELAPHQLSDWRRQARQGLLALPGDVMDELNGDALPAFGKRRPRPIGFGVALGDVGWVGRVACGAVRLTMSSVGSPGCAHCEVSAAVT